MFIDICKACSHHMAQICRMRGPASHADISEQMAQHMGVRYIEGDVQDGYGTRHCFTWIEQRKILKGERYLLVSHGFIFVEQGQMSLCFPI